MSEMEPHKSGIDSLLRRSMAAPVPSLPPDFDLRLMREVSRGSLPLDQYRRILLAGYGLASVLVSAVVMRGHGINWGAIAVMIGGALGVVAAVRYRLRSARGTV